MSDDQSSALRLVTPPTEEPITLAQAKTFLRIEHTAEDAAITTAITAARQFAEQYLRTALLPQTWDYSVANPCHTHVRLPLGPVRSITNITATNELGATTTINASNYRLQVDGYGVLFTNVPQTEKLTVRFSVSVAESANLLPALMIQGMLHHIAVMIENRDGAVALPLQAMQCYQPFRQVTL